MDPLDRLPTGTPIEGWGGTAAADHNPLGLYYAGPQPATTFHCRLTGTSTAQGEPLPPGIASLVLTRTARHLLRLRQMVARARIAAVRCR